MPKTDMKVAKAVSSFSNAMAAMTLGPTFSSALQKAILGPDAKSWSKKFATPAALQPIVMKLMEMSLRAQYAMEVEGKRMQSKYQLGGTAIMEKFLETEPGANNPTVQAFDKRLEGYLGYINECIGNGKAMDPDCIYYTVTAPLLMGWYPNKDGTGIDPAQLTRKPADSGYVARMMLMAGERAKFEGTQNLNKFLEITYEEAKNRMADAKWMAEELARAMADIAAAAASAALSSITKSSVWLPLGVGAGLIGFLWFRSKGR